MVIKEVAVLAVATLCALGAGGGVMQWGAQAMSPPSRQGRIVKAADGHYWATAEVDQRTVRFLVDTGASAVALTRGDAARLGIDPARLNYDRPVATALGGERAASVTLDHIDIAGRASGTRQSAGDEGRTAGVVARHELSRPPVAH